MNLRRFTHIET